MITKRKRFNPVGLLILLTWLIAAGLFYVIFFVLTPLITGAIPAGNYHQLAVVATYVFVAWIGGIGLPLFVGIAGTVLFASAL
jgi:hypothetical protein